MTDEGNRRHKKIMKELDDLNTATRKAVDEITARLLKTTTMSEDSILNSIDKSVSERRYTEKYIASAPEFKQKLLREYKDIGKSMDILKHRKFEIREELERQVRDNIISSRILGTVDWSIRESYSTHGQVYIEANLHDNEQVYEFMKDPFDYDYHWSYLIYTFPDGRKIDMHCDDGELSINLNDKDITPEEYKQTFKELGIKISFDSLKYQVTEQQEKADRLRNIIELFGDSDENNT